MLSRIVACNVKITVGLFGSLLTTSIVSAVKPFLLRVETLAVMAPFSPAFKWLELATTAPHPQDVLTSFMISSSEPALTNSKECSNCGP